MSFTDIFEDDIVSCSVKKVVSKAPNELGKEVTTYEYTLLNCAVYDHGITEKREKENTKKQQLIHVYTKKDVLKIDDEIKFQDRYFRIEFSQKTNDHFFLKGFADVE